MALATETQSWLEGLKAEGGLTDEAYNALKSSIEGSSKANDYIKGSQLRQADYSRVMSEVQKAQKAVEDSQLSLKTREDQVTKYQQDLGTWKVDADKNFQKALTDRETAANKAAAAIQRLQSLAVANGLPVDEVLKDLEVTAPNPEVKPSVGAGFDTSQFVTRDQIQQTVAESALIDATIYDLSVEYQELTGKSLKGAASLVNEAIAAKKPLAVYVAEKFKFEDLRKQRAEGDIQTRIDAAVKARETEILSAGNLPGANSGLRTDIKGSPILSSAADGTLKLPTEPGGGVSAAVAAFNSGKFKR